MTNKIKAMYLQALAILVLGLTFAFFTENHLAGAVAVAAFSLFAFGHLWLGTATYRLEATIESDRAWQTFRAKQQDGLLSAVFGAIGAIQQIWSKDGVPSRDQEDSRLDRLYKHLMEGDSEISKIIRELTSERQEAIFNEVRIRHAAVIGSWGTVEIPSDVLASTVMLALLFEPEFEKFFLNTSEADQKRMQEEWARIMDGETPGEPSDH